MSKNNKKRSSKSRIPPDVAAQYFSHLSNSGVGGVGGAGGVGDGGGNNNSINNSNNRDPPCSPEEVKALMSMFAEIMGMAEKKSSVSFMFGSNNNDNNHNNKNGSTAAAAAAAAASAAENWPPSALAAAARAASMYMPPEDFLDYEDDEEDDDDEEDGDDEDDDDEEYDDDHHNNNNNNIENCDSKRPAIDPNDWKDLEEVARDEKREEELRQNKAVKKREKKQRKKERLRKEAADKANEAAKKKQEKVVTSWKSRVVAACQAKEATKVAALLGECPFKKEEEGMIAKEHVDFLLSSCVAKTREGVDSGSDCRLKLAEFVASISFQSFFAISHKTGRTSLHAACFIGDHFFLQFVLKHRSDAAEEAKSHINDLCEESGFAPIHYAVLSGSKEVLEILLEHGSKLDICTDKDETSLRGKGITALQLAELILSGGRSDLDSNGSVLDDLNDCFLSNADDRRQYHAFLRLATSRLSYVSKNGYSPPLPTKAEEDQDDQLDLLQNKVVTSRSKKKKKKKKQQQQQQQSATSAVAATTTPSPQIHQEDPMIAALQGMGFSDEQIEAAVEACGGTARATADDLVMWIFTQESGEASSAIATTEAPADTADSQQAGPAPIMESPQESAERAEREQVEAFRLAEEGRLAQQRLTQKREEQRRRNREWNNREQARQQQAKVSAPPPQYKSRPGVLPPGQQPIVNLQGPTPDQVAKTRVVPNGIHHGSKNGAAALKLPSDPVKILCRPMVPPEVSTSAASNVKKHPPGLETIGNDFSYVGDGSAFAEDATVSSLGSGIVGQNEWMNETDSVANSYVNDAPALAGFQGLGTNNVPPPGFQSGMMMQHTPEEAHDFIENEVLGFLDDPNATGEIRATARAFVPTNFKTPPGLTTGPSNYPVPELSTIGESNAGMNPMSSLLSGGLAPYPVGQQHQASLLNGFDRPNPATPYSPVQSAASSITGFSGADDMAAPQGVGLPPSLRLGGFQNSNVPMGSSLLDPLSLGTQSSSMQQPLWRGAPQPSVAGAPLGGLAPLSEGLPSLSAFGGAFGATPSSEDKTNGAPSGGGWGDTTTTTSSSIW